MKDNDGCPICGSDNCCIVATGVGQNGEWQSYECLDCGYTWSVEVKTYFPHGRPDALARLAVVDSRERDKGYKGYFAHTNEGVCLLLEMAITGEFPDVTFSDQECELWSCMRRVLRLHGMEVQHVV